MKRDKAWLQVGGRTLVVRAVRVLQQVASPVVCLAGPHQSLPVLPAGTVVLRDESPYQGPLTAMARGFRFLRLSADAVFVSAIDLCFLTDIHVSRLLTALEDHDAVVPDDGDRLHPLCAVYRVSLLSHIDEMLAAGDHKVMHLLERIDVRRAGEDIYGDRECLTNLNTPEDYDRVAGLL